MPHLFLAHSAADQPYAGTLRTALAARGYQVWQVPAQLDPRSPSYARAIERAIGGSMALLLIWSAPASDDGWVARQLTHTQRLHKRIIVISRDTTALPTTLVDCPILPEQPPAVLDALLPHLPSASAEDLLLALLTSNIMGDRIQAIQDSPSQIKNSPRRNEMLAVLDDVARNDLIEDVRARAQAVVDTETSGEHTAERHLFGAKCTQCGHINYHDKRLVCPANGTVKRGSSERAGKALDELFLTCEKCKHEFKALIDCGGYR